MVILIVGDGDFSFTKGIVKYIQSDHRPNITSTCYESYEEIIKKYSQASDNICYIKDNGVSVIMNVDATKLSQYDFGCQFNLIIFNFPHIGGKSNIKNNRKLLANFFQSIKESRILSEYGLVCVSLCQGQAGTPIDLKDRIFANSWQIQEMAARSDFVIHDVRQFDTRGLTDYIPTGFRSQEKRFRLEGARTYVFRAHGGPAARDHDDALMTTVELSNGEYWAPCWLALCLRTRLDAVTMGDQDGDKLVRSRIEEGFFPVTWQQCRAWKDAEDCAYWLFDVGRFTSSEEAARALCGLENGPAPLVSLCSSPWQQVALVINEFWREDTEGARSALVCHGECYRRSPHGPARSRFVVTIESLATDTAHEDCIATDGVNAAEHAVVKALLARSGIELLTLVIDRGPVGTRSVTWASLVAHSNGGGESSSPRRFRAVVIDISRDRLPWQPDSDALQSVFPTPLVIIDESLVTSPPSLMATEQTRLETVQDALDWRVYRDMSFWWGGDRLHDDELLAAISEVCRCVFRDQFGGPVELLEQYEPDCTDQIDIESGIGAGGPRRRSLCVRMFLETRQAPLSKAVVNTLQSAVRRHCQHLLGIELR